MRIAGVSGFFQLVDAGEQPVALLEPGHLPRPRSSRVTSHSGFIRLANRLTDFS